MTKERRTVPPQPGGRRKRRRLQLLNYTKHDLINQRFDVDARLAAFASTRAAFSRATASRLARSASMPVRVSWCVRLSSFLRTSRATARPAAATAAYRIQTVSYTHLTLPTIYSV